MARLRFDNQTGTLGATLTAGGLTLTLASPWSAATVVGPDFVAIELEPPTVGVRSANFEVIYATPVNDSASAVVTARGQEGTAAVQHNAGSVWSHGPTAQDFADTDFVNPMTTAGDLILGTTAGAPIRLAKGADSQVLTIDPTTHLPLWATPAAAPVTSVAGKTGAVTLVEADVANLATDLASKVALATVTTKGDLLVATASATLARLGVGSNGQVLTADSTQTTGAKWATPSASVSFPLTSAGDETFQPSGVSGNALTLHNPANAFLGLTISGAPAGGASANPVVVAATGGQADIGLTLQGAGAGVVTIFANNGGWLFSGSLNSQVQTLGDAVFQPNLISSNALTLHNNASAVNGVTITGKATGQGPTIVSSGSDANINLGLSPAGTGVILAYGGSSNDTIVRVGGSGNLRLQIGGNSGTVTAENANGSVGFAMAPVLSGVNYLQAGGSTTGNPPAVTAAGSDTNIGMLVQGKGSGNITVQAGNFQYVFHADGNGSLIFSNAASSVGVVNSGTFNVISSSGVGLFCNAVSATNVGHAGLWVGQNGGLNSTNALYVDTAGGTKIQSLNDNNALAANLTIAPGANGTLIFTGGATTSPGTAFTIAGVNSGVNGLTLTNAATTAAPTLSATGTDTNIDTRVVGKGTGGTSIAALKVTEGANATMGAGTLAGGTATVNTTRVTANSRIFVTDQGGGTLANVGALTVSARVAGTSFTVTSTNALDASNFVWMIVEPA